MTERWRIWEPLDGVDFADKSPVIQPLELSAADCTFVAIRKRVEHDITGAFAMSVVYEEV